ncbi:RNA polymerase sigma-70 factor (ECF subfamily) [Bacillus pakistanensis]|uniref:RNA polymerase sigma-70 factor (ECF subfamily) n=1 Tax=Rossellomorea pakistanensis TaxID=992288 RepID=A0ABS2NHI4_9BACI|nr:RNA polymerase sigma-70 factor [Bacillus pakistanensis]MBM7587327.1 RNA polymerase sigma-70 factor (ECF subfamily) [Bacillus pakistanensis]
MDFETLYRTYRTFVYSVAYRLLGSVSEAEDAAQDILLKSQTMDKDAIRNKKAYLLKMTTNHCLNILQSARKKREVYTGEWLPEPEVDLAKQNPMETILQNESVSYAFLVLLEKLTPVERAVFVLREALRYDYGEIAEMVNKSEANCRKIYSRCKEKIEREVPVHPQPSVHTEKMIHSFIQGSKTGNFEEFIHLLTTDAILVTDGGGKVRAAIFPILGKERIQTFLESVVPRGFLQSEIQPTIINGQAGFLEINKDGAKTAICFEWDESGTSIRRIYIVVNPDKLQHILVR